MQKPTDWKYLSTIVLGLVILGGIFFGLGNPIPVEAVSETVIISGVLSGMVFPEVEAQDNEKIDAILAKVTEDDAWEDKSELLATEEWEDNDWKDLYRAISDIYGDIDDEDDIEYVREDESTEFSGMDSDEEDGVVTQFLKIKYEDKSGDDHKVYLTVETEFDEGDLDDQEIYESE